MNDKKLDVRWKQRFDNLTKAYQELQDAVKLADTKSLTKLEKQGVIQGFEYTHELAWNVLKDYLEEYGGHTNLVGSKDTTREAFKRGLVTDGETWMLMINSRNLTSHTYNQDLAETVFKNIVEQFYPAFKELMEKFTLLSEPQ